MDITRRALLLLAIIFPLLLGCHPPGYSHPSPQAIYKQRTVDFPIVRTAGDIQLVSLGVVTGHGFDVPKETHPLLETTPARVELIARVPRKLDRRVRSGENRPTSGAGIACVPIKATLQLGNCSSTNLDLYWTEQVATISFSIPITYPSTIRTGKVVFTDPNSNVVLGTWDLDSLPQTRNALAGQASAEPVAVSSSCTLHLFARPVGGGSDAASWVAVGGEFTDSRWMIRQARIYLPWETDMAQQPNVASFDSARKFLVSCHVGNGGMCNAVELRGELVHLRTDQETLSCPAVPIEALGAGYTVKGRRWSLDVKGYNVSLRAPDETENRYRPGIFTVDIVVESAASQGWFEFHKGEGKYAGGSEEFPIDIPLRDAGQTVDLLLEGRVCQELESKPFSAVIPVKSGPVPSGFPALSGTHLRRITLEGQRVNTDAQ